MALHQTNVNVLPKKGIRSSTTARRAARSTPSLQERYETATFSLAEHFSQIDVWLAGFAAGLGHSFFDSAAVVGPGAGPRFDRIVDDRMGYACKPV